MDKNTQTKEAVNLALNALGSYEESRALLIDFLKKTNPAMIGVVEGFFIGTGYKSKKAKVELKKIIPS